MISMLMNYGASEVLLMDKDNYIRTELDIVHFHTADVIATSGDIIEESNSQSGGGKLIDP